MQLQTEGLDENCSKGDITTSVIPMAALYFILKSYLYSFLYENQQRKMEQTNETANQGNIQLLSEKAPAVGFPVAKVGVGASLHSNVAPITSPVRNSAEAEKRRPDVAFQIDAACGEEQTAHLQLRG